MNKKFNNLMYCLICGKEITLKPNRKYCNNCKEIQYKKNSKEYYVRNRKEILNTCRLYREQNKEYINNWHKKYYKDNRGILIVKSIEYQNKNKEARKKAVMKHHDNFNFGGNRELALERDNYKCCICNDKKRLMVHHIDENSYHNSDNPNNNLDNLITLCQNCHNTIHNIKRYKRICENMNNYNNNLLKKLAYE